MGYVMLLILTFCVGYFYGSYKAKQKAKKILSKFPKGE